MSIQDSGRPGWARFGVPQSGAMDRLAFHAANAALGNAADTPVIEVSRGGVRLECRDGEIGFALAGGGFILEHRGHRLGSWRLGVLRQGETLLIRPGPWGNWCCLALAGQIGMPAWLGSRATHSLSGLGGGSLSAGHEIRVAETRRCEDLARDLPCPIFSRPRRLLRLTLGPQERFFDPGAVKALTEARWSVTAAADRMGTRLAGPLIAPNTLLDMASEPLARGSVQVAGDGVATILMADHQTTGGYPRMATVLDCDLDAFSQTSPGQPLAFQPVSAAEAIALARDHAERCARFIERLRRRRD